MALRSLTTNTLKNLGRSNSLRGIATASLPDLPYDYSALDPVIIPEIMELHHKKHHQAYVSNLNAALEKAADAEAKGDLPALISLQPAIKFNGGGKGFFASLLPPPPFLPLSSLFNFCCGKRGNDEG